MRFYTTLQTPANLQPSTFQPATVPSPALLVAASAALAGFLVHSVFDLITWLPSIGLIVMLLAALAMHAAAALRPGSYSPRVARLATAAAVLALVAFGPALTRAESAREALAQAIRSAGAGDWSAAAASMEQAVAADPRNVHYLRQRAFAYGVLAASATAPVDRAAVHKALGSYAALLRLQATWAPDLLNAGMLYQLAGDAAETERLWAAALPRWQAWPLPSLVLGDWYASQGRGEEAYNLFESALARNVRSGDTAACRRNPVCLRLSQTLPIPSATIGDVHRDARRLLDDGQAAQALSALQSVPASTRSSLIWIDRAEAHIALGQGRAAAYALETALTLEGNNGADTASRLALLRAGLFTLQPDYPAAIAALESVVRPRLVILPYDLVNRQFSLPGILVPRLAMLERSQDDLEAYERLSQLYRLVGREDDAQWASAQATALAAELAEKPQPLTRASDTSGTRPVQQPDSR